MLSTNLSNKVMQLNIKQKVKKCFNTAATSYNTAAYIQLQAGTNLLNKLNDLNLAPKFIADIGAGTGLLTHHLAAKYPNSLVAYVDIARAMLQEARWQPNQLNKIYINADFDQLPFAAASIDLIFSNFSLQWSLNPKHTFSELYRVLKPNSYGVFTTLGASTLAELRHCWQLIDTDHHTNYYQTLTSIRQNLTEAHLNVIAIEKQIITAYFPNIGEMMQNLKAVGANCVINKQTNTLIGKKVFQQLAQYYERYRNKQGQLPLSYEVIYVSIHKQ